MVSFVSLAWLCVVWWVSGLVGWWVVGLSVWFGLVWFGLVWCGLVWFGVSAGVGFGEFGCVVVLGSLEVFGAVLGGVSSEVGGWVGGWCVCGGVCGTSHSEHGVSVQARVYVQLIWVVEHLGASSLCPRHPFPALMAGVNPGRVPVHTALKNSSQP